MRYFRFALFLGSGFKFNPVPGRSDLRHHFDSQGTWRERHGDHRSDPFHYRLYPDAYLFLSVGIGSNVELNVADSAVCDQRIALQFFLK